MNPVDNLGPGFGVDDRWTVEVPHFILTGHQSSPVTVSDHRIVGVARQKSVEVVGIESVNLTLD